MNTYKIYYQKILDEEVIPGTTILSADSEFSARRRFFNSVAQFDYDFSILKIELI